MPSPGKLTLFSTPNLPNLRVDTGYETGSEVPLFYDAMLAKVIAWGMDREQARRTLLDGLRGTRLVGVAWNGNYLADVLDHKRFVQAKMTTQFLGEIFSDWKGEVRSKVEQTDSEDRVVACALNPWQVFGTGDGKVGTGATVDRDRSSTESYDFPKDGPLVAEYPGKVLRVLASAGQAVSKGQVVVVCESMKMEFAYAAPFETKVKTVGLTEGQVISAGTVLVEWEDAATC
jgi:acetyl/propionyl-CoA carboxylase alpha subunit